MRLGSSVVDCSPVMRQTRVQFPAETCIIFFFEFSFHGKQLLQNIWIVTLVNVTHFIHGCLLWGNWLVLKLNIFWKNMQNWKYLLTHCQNHSSLWCRKCSNVGEDAHITLHYNNSDTDHTAWVYSFILESDRVISQWKQSIIRPHPLLQTVGLMLKLGIR